MLEQAQVKHLSNINHEEQAWEISVQKSVERAHYMWKQKIINGKRDLNGNNGMKKTEEGETAMKVVPLNQVGSFNKEDGGNPAEGKVGKNMKEVVHVHNAKKELVRKEAIAPSNDQ